MNFISFIYRYKATFAETTYSKAEKAKFLPVAKILSNFMFFKLSQTIEFEHMFDLFHHNDQ